MSKAAVMQGVYVDCKFMPGLKSARISIDLPIEHSNEFLRMFGAPDRANPVHVAVARLQEGAGAPVPEKPVEPEAVEKSKPKRSSLAAVMCKENEAFQVWLAEKYPKVWDRYYAYEIGSGGNPSPAAANDTLKAVLGIASKKELDAIPEAAARFDALRVDFELRDLVR